MIYTRPIQMNNSRAIGFKNLVWTHFEFSYELTFVLYGLGSHTQI